MDYQRQVRMKEESLVLVDTAVYEVVSSRLLNDICFSLKSSEKKNHELCKSNSEIQIAKTCSHKPGNTASKAGRWRKTITLNYLVAPILYLPPSNPEHPCLSQSRERLVVIQIRAT